MKIFSNIISLIILISVNQVALAHETQFSVLSTVFGENLTHWLIAHQGLVIVGGIFLAVLIFHQLKSLLPAVFGK